MASERHPPPDPTAPVDADAHDLLDLVETVALHLEHAFGEGTPPWRANPPATGGVTKFAKSLVTEIGKARRAYGAAPAARRPDDDRPAPALLHASLFARLLESYREAARESEVLSLRERAAALAREAEAARERLEQLAARRGAADGRKGAARVRA